MTHGFTPFKGIKDAQSLLKKIREIHSVGIPRHGCTPNLYDLVTKILTEDPSQRLDFSQIFTHPWIIPFTKKFNISVEEYISVKRDKIHHTKNQDQPSPNIETEPPTALRKKNSFKAIFESESKGEIFEQAQSRARSNSN